MIKAIELARPYSCLNKAAADEPIFVLRAHDPLFGAIVRLWAAAAHGLHEDEKRYEACALADEGDAWFGLQPKEIPPPSIIGAQGIGGVEAANQLRQRPEQSRWRG
jgi:hypothetical protein